MLGDDSGIHGLMNRPNAKMDSGKAFLHPLICWFPYAYVWYGETQNVKTARKIILRNKELLGQTGCSQSRINVVADVAAATGPALRGPRAWNSKIFMFLIFFRFFFIILC